MILREQALTCLACGDVLAAEEVGGRHVVRCVACGGIWMEVATFLALLREAQPDKAVDELMVHNDGSHRRLCPVCGELMDLAWLDFLALDQCEAHGVWLDRAELDKALKWQVEATLVGKAPPSRTEQARTAATIAAFAKATRGSGR